MASSPFSFILIVFTSGTLAPASDTDFDTQEELKEELLQYLYYYNHERPHQRIDGKKTNRND
ncbi:hypothetical protein B8T70_05505 [Flavobacterium sp. AJR]|nr:hypothetical protein B8T70_05505 [Flavobacterium sp. AJR]